MNPDDDRRDIAVLGDVDAKMLNRMARRNRGADPFEVSGDALTRQTKNDAGDPAKNPTSAATNTEPTIKEQETMSTNTIISDLALKVHRGWCEAANCRADRMGANNDGELEAIVHNGPEYGFITEPDAAYSPAGELTVQLEEFNDLTSPTSTAIILRYKNDSIELNLYDLQRLQYLLGMAEQDLIGAMDEQEAREDGAE